MKEFKATPKGLLRPIYLMIALPYLALAELIIYYLKMTSEGFTSSILSKIWPFMGFSVVLIPFGLLILYFQFKKGMFDNFRIIMTDEYIEGPKNYIPNARSFVSINNNKKIYKEFIIPNYLKFKFVRTPRGYYPRIQIPWKQIDYKNSYPRKIKLWPCQGQIISLNDGAISIGYVFEKNKLKEMAHIIKNHEKRFCEQKENEENKVFL